VTVEIDGLCEACGGERRMKSVWKKVKTSVTPRGAGH
jgi:hypothetical protein